MMLMLIPDVLHNVHHVGLAYGEGAVPILPMKRRVRRPLGLQPFGCSRFDFFDDFGRAMVLRVKVEDMDMVLDRVNQESWRIPLLENPGKVAMEFVANIVLDNSLPILGRENKVNKNFCEGLSPKGLRLCRPFRALVYGCR
jgi:hypothetical protein